MALASDSLPSSESGHDTVKGALTFTREIKTKKEPDHQSAGQGA